MTICTATDVFNRIGAANDVRTNKSTMVTALISQVEAEIEAKIGRKISSNALTDIILQDGVNCTIFGQTLYLNGIYRDVISISSVYEYGVEIPAFIYGGGSGYRLDTRSGSLIRYGQNWSCLPFDIKISGSFGLVSDDIKKIAIEMVAAKSGLWKYTFMTEGGEVEGHKTDVPKSTLQALEKYVLKDIL